MRDYLSGLMRDLLNSRPTLPAEPVTLAPPPAEKPEAAPIKKPVKLWDLAQKHHCPVVGTCLRMDDLVRFARRYNFDADLHDEFELHVEAVGQCQTRNDISEALQKHLDRKYAVSIARFSKLKTDAAVLAAWRDCLAKGEVGGPLWATYTHKAASTETRDIVYADIHMLSHQVGAGQAADARRLAYLEKENADLKRSLESEANQHQVQTAKWQKRLSELEATLSTRIQLEEEVADLRTRVIQAESGEALAEMGRHVSALQRATEQMAAAMERIAELEKNLLAAQQEVAELTRQRDTASAEREALELMLMAGRRSEAGCAGQCECCEGAPSQRCVLYVGGRTNLVSQYRELAERLGVRLVHHDGGQEEALSRLPELIHRADAVICPTDCVSHTAYYNLKSHCKRTGKPCLFFKGTGVSSFAVAMARIARGEFSLSGPERTVHA